MRSLRRGAFLGLIGAACATGAAAAAQAIAPAEIDPAQSSASPSLRVLLGPGVAEPNPGGEGFLFQGRPYRGSFTRDDQGAIVNVVGLEAYLYSVVPREMSAGWPAQALAAQAICARTYVLQRSNPRSAYDLVPSEIDQVYLGASGEVPAGRDAVDATAGQVLRFADRFASVAYSSCCGGHTEANGDAWGGTTLPYLQGVVCTTCSASPNFRWNAAIPIATIAERFATQIAPLGSLQSIGIDGQDASGRARAFELVADRGTTLVKGSTFRLGVGPRVLRSLLVRELRVEAQTTVLIEGGGLGHGVGMCQWGARGMALAGASARDILTLYFPGTEIGND